MKLISTRRLAAGLTVAALAATTVALTGGAAQAAPGDFNDPLPSSFTPTTGTNLTVPTVTVPQGCPAGSTTVVGQLFGGTLPSDGQLMYGPANNPLATSFTYQPQSFQDTFADAGISTIPAGVYSLKTQCQNDLGDNLRVYSSQVQFTSATAYVQPTVVATTTTVTVTPPSNATLAVTLNAAVAPDSAGSVEFFDGAASLGSDASSPYAFTTGANTLGSSHAYKAVFTSSSALVTGSTSPVVNYTIPAFSGVQAQYNVTTTVGAGALTLTIASPNVPLGTMAFNASSGKLEAGGSLTAATLIDLRAANPGWNVSGQTTDFAGSPSGAINGANLGWDPAVIDSEGTAVEGPVVAGAGGVSAADPSVAGLKTSRVMATAAAGAGRGTTHLGGTLTLQAPTSTPAGTYSATLTLTAI
jgi:hypothetical protein